MGKIAKQTLKGSAYTYVGAVLGFVSTGLLMPKVFSPTQVGLVSLLIALTQIFSTFSNLGFNSVLSRLFPYFRRQEKGHNGILNLGLIVVLLGTALAVSGLLLLKHQIIGGEPEDVLILENNYQYLPFLILALSLFNLFDTYNRMLYDAVSGIFLREVLVRSLNIALIVLFVYDYIDFPTFVLCYVLSYIAPTILIALLLLIRRQFYIPKPNRFIIGRLKGRMLSLGFFGILTTFSGVAVMNIDKYMVSYYLGLDATGIYSVTFYFAVLVLMPSRALRKISAIFISEAWKEKRLDTIGEIYRKSTINQLLIAALIFVGIWANIDNIFRIIPDYSAGIYVILFIGLANIIDMASGVSAGIISLSKDYKVHAYIMIVMIASVIISNMLLIPAYGMNGAAMASMLSVFVTILLRFLFLYFKHGLQPYKIKHLLIIITAAAVLFLNSFLPYLSNLYIDILVRSSLIGIVFITTAYFLRLSEDANQLIRKYLRKFTPKD
ncbi:MAG: oligosaccharide flippase family protein [Bacteroidota bacterium]|nr:oligosaccharide flippase family protein [Bacteroidota bacterium]